MQLDIDELSRHRDALLGPISGPLMTLAFDLGLGRPANTVPPDVVSTARNLGWLRDDSVRLTQRGYLVADSLREFRFWLERDRRLPCQDVVPHLSSGHYSGKSVLEVGCGAGCNLLSLSAVNNSTVGVEPVPLYKQMGQILCEREQIQPPDIRIASAEKLPFADNQFDIVLCVSAHQYMDIRPALCEMARVLRPGGELQIVGGTLDTYVRVGLAPIRAGGIRALKPYLTTIFNTAMYQTVGSRLIKNVSGNSTAYPIYPMPRHMHRWLASCGLQPLRPLEKLFPETCYSYGKPADTVSSQDRL